MTATLQAIDNAVAHAMRSGRLVKEVANRQHETNLHYSSGPGFHVNWMTPADLNACKNRGTMSVAEYDAMPYHRRALPKDLIVAVADHVANNTGKNSDDLCPEDMLLLRHLEGALLAIELKQSCLNIAEPVTLT